LDLLNPPRLDKASVKKSFNRAANRYNRAAILQEEVLSRLIQRLTYIRHSPALILDMGCGTGIAFRRLKKQYSKSAIVSMDLAFSMLLESRQQYGFFDKKLVVNADMERLPFADKRFDLLFSSLALQWANDLPETFMGMRRISRPGALLMFATFGPKTLSELRQSWMDVDQKPHVHQFMDMHDIGDALVAAGFAQPVVDAETIELEYSEFRQVLDDLKDIGASNADRNRSRGLMTPAKLRKLEQNYCEHGFRDGKFIASYEVVYGHAWIPDQD
jgi:malonyl-CoA O-methyltransferase